MHRSSESVAALASALAKAQAELVNPEKSLTATIRTGRAGEGAERTFRYAPLSSGLDIVRKTLGQHEIATVQTTALDQAAGLVNLTTMLAHASGEWIASDWPVCAIADMATPQRMGAALTYARRYALFTLVGIAGEDDLDAPDLHDGADTRSPGPTNGAGTADAARNAGVDQPLPRRTGNGHARGAAKGASAPVILAPDQSAVLRDRLLGEVAGIPSADQAASWARDVLPPRTASPRPTPRPWRTPSNANCRSSPKPRGGGPGGAPKTSPPGDRIDACGFDRRRRVTSGHRQERPRDRRATALSQQRASAVRRPAGLPHLRPQALRPASSTLHAAARARPQGERRIRGPALPQASPGGASRRR